MNLQALSRKLFRLPSTAAGSSRKPSAIEPLESRIAPATLVSPTVVTFQDKTGDNVTVTISKPLFTAANVSKVFTFDTGSVNGSNTTAQQLELLNVTKLGAVGAGLNISITAVPVNSSPGIVNVGYIDASGIDLGDVTVGGDLARINAGDLHFSAPAIHSLTVNSMGAQGLATQQPNGNLNSNFAGPVGSITINGDLNGASIGVGGGSMGTLGSLTVTGSIIGGSIPYSGSVRTQGAVASVLIDGSIVGGGGASSGLIGTASSLGNVVVMGDITGGGGAFSGAILSTKSMTSIGVVGNISGGTGANSGEVGTAATLSSIIVGGSVTGGTGKSSGDILATGNITLAAIDGNLVGGSGVGSGEIGSAASIQTVNIGGNMTAGAGIHAFQNINSIGVDDGTFYDITVTDLALPLKTQVLHPAVVSSDGGAGIQDSFIVADKGSIGSLQVGSALTGGDGEFDALSNATITAGASINSITAATGFGIAISNSHIHAGKDIGPIVATGTTQAISGSIFRAGHAIGSITANAPSSGVYGNSAIGASGFDAGGNIGDINTIGPIVDSVFVAGIDLGTGFAVSGAGAFDNTTAAGFGFGSIQSNVAASIGNITVSAGDNEAPAFIQSSTFLAGVHGPGVDKTFGTKDDLVSKNSTIGTITAPDGLSGIFVESGSIGATNVGQIASTTYIATDTALTAGGIGPITVLAQIMGGLSFGLAHSSVSGSTTTHLATASKSNYYGIYDSTFISNSGIGGVNVTISGQRPFFWDGGGITGSTFQAGHALGNITVIDSAYGSGGANYGILNSTFNGGLAGYGGTGDISVTLTDTGAEGNSAAISGVHVDATVCSCMSASMGAIYAENDNTGSGAAGIVDSVFRVHGSIGPITATTFSTDTVASGIAGSTFSAFGSIGDLNITGSVTADANGPSRFLAGYDIGADMAFGNEDLGAKSLALQSAQSVGNVTVTGYFQGSDIAASINPGAGYIFGDSSSGVSSGNDSNIGSGGSIGYVTIGSALSVDSNPLYFDYATSHGIEAANFPSSDTPPVSFGVNNQFTSYVPVVLYVDGGSNDVRITNLTQNINTDAA